VTHDQEEALSLSDRLVVLEHGSIQQIGTPEDCYLRPANLFVADFLGTANIFKGQVRNNAGSYMMQIAEGIQVPCPPPPVGTSTANLVVRPENLELRPAGQSSMLNATVTDVIYLGQTVRYQLDGGHGSPVIATAGGSTARFTPGEKVDISWQPSNAWFVNN